MNAPTSTSTGLNWIYILVLNVQFIQENYTLYNTVLRQIEAQQQWRIFQKRRVYFHLERRCTKLSRSVRLLINGFIKISYSFPHTNTKINRLKSFYIFPFKNKQAVRNSLSHLSQIRNDAITHLQRGIWRQSTLAYINWRVYVNTRDP